MNDSFSSKDDYCLSAEEMLLELEANRLEVVLIPAPEKRHVGHCVRAVQDANPEWYRKFCAEYPSARKGTRIRTRIKRQATINALKRILEGETRGVYVERLLDFLERQSAKKNNLPF